MAFPLFHGLQGEDALEFCDAFELTCLLPNEAGYDMMLQIVPLVLKGEARWQYNNLDRVNKSNWSTLKKMFLDQYQSRESAQELLEALRMWQQEDLQSYIAYKEHFLNLWLRLELHEEGSEMPNFVIKKCFLNGLCNPLWKKVVCEAPANVGELFRLLGFNIGS